MDNLTWYQIASTIISILSLLGFGVVMKFFWEDQRAKRIQNSEEAKKRAKAEKQAETREVFREEVQPLIETMDQIKALAMITSTGTITLLRDRMKSALNFCKIQGWASSSDKANWFELYNTYKTLGGNHFKEYVDQWKQEMESLPTEDEYKKNKLKNTRKKNSG